MNSLVYQQIDELLANVAEPRRLTCESALRAGAVTLRNTPAATITATTMMCDVPVDQLDLLKSAVADLANEYQLDARIQQSSGSYSVRFTRRLPSTERETFG